jgi:AraC-like DNA-binding protein/quercetin dioxygenase-like cupin family protein
MGALVDRLAVAVPLTRSRSLDDRSRWERWSRSGDDDVEVLVAREPDASFHLHWHEEWSLGAIVAGTCAFSCAGRCHQARAGDVVIIPPYAVHTAGTSSGEFAMVMLYLPTELVVRRVDARLARVGLDGNVWRDPAGARALCRAVRGRRLDGVWRVMAQAIEHCRPHDRAASPDPRVVRISALLRDAPDRMPDLAEIARVAGVSREHLHRLFRNTLGVTPGQYLRLSRIALARRLLRRGEPIIAAAGACGFADQSHFTRWFKRYLGVTPGAFAGHR